MLQSNFLIVPIALVALFYSTAGQAGGTAFLNVMAFISTPPDSMRATALLLNVVAATYGSIRMGNTAPFDRKILVALIVPSAGAAFIGGFIKLGAPSYFVVTRLALMIAAALVVLPRRSSSEVSKPLSPGTAFLIGTGTGFLSGLTGVGGGTYLAPLLIGVSWATPRQAAAISPLFILCNSLAGLTGVITSGQTLPSMAWSYASGALVGAVVGTAIGQRWMSDRAVKAVLAIILVIGGLRLLIQS